MTNLDHMTFETREQARIREVAKRENEFAEADARLELWTIQAAIYPKRAFVVIHLGHNADMEPLESQHGVAHAFLGPQRIIAANAKEAQKQALDLFTVDEITIRIVR